jgi:hypothetical protein
MSSCVISFGVLYLLFLILIADGANGSLTKFVTLPQCHNYAITLVPLLCNSLTMFCHA